MTTERALETLETGRVVRYHAAPTVQPQNVGHHSWGVAILVLYITNNTASPELLRECLMHDTAEYFTGDVPFTVKRDNVAVKTQLDLMEETARREFLLLGPIVLSDHDKAVLKLADTLDGFLWCFKTEAAPYTIRKRWEASFQIGVVKFSTVLTVDEIVRAQYIINSVLCSQ